MDDLLWIGPALIAGIIAVRFYLPPMVGYLLAGFVLNFFGFVDHDRLTMIGNLGVTLLLFTIGLKLDLRSLLRPAIWAGNYPAYPDRHFTVWHFAILAESHWPECIFRFGY